MMNLFNFSIKTIFEIFRKYEAKKKKQFCSIGDGETKNILSTPTSTGKRDSKETYYICFLH